MELRKYLLPGLILIFIGAGIFYGYKIYSLSKAHTDLKEQYASVNRINYGLFNIQLWKERAFELFRAKADDFTISPEVYKDVEAQLSVYLKNVYDEYIGSGKLFNQMLADAEKSGKINSFFSQMIKDNIDEQIGKLDLVAKIPVMAKTLSAELKANEPKLKVYIAQGLESMLFEGEDARYIDPRKNFFMSLGYNDVDEYNQKTREKIEIQKSELNNLLLLEYIILLSAVLVIIFLSRWMSTKVAITLVIIISIVFLLLGVTLPMIDIDARLNQFRMALLGEEIAFDEQFLYYQSKSILDVTKTLIQGRGIDLKIVGVLVLMFSVVIPFIKLVLSGLFMYTDQIRRSKIARSIIFYLGKWSMADVFVVAMFMAYIGFYGIITSQLLEIKGNETGYAVETLNYSQLSPGALFFTTYCILSIVTGILIQKMQLKES
jgi:hypothetical protein